MTQTATQIAKEFVKTSAPDLYLDVEHVDKDLISVTYRYRKEKFINVSMFDMMFRKKSEEKKPNKFSGELVARLATSSKDDSKGACRNAYVVNYAVVNAPGGGLGRLLYYIVMHYAGASGITADRVKSSYDAVSAWNKLSSDSEVKKLPLDDFYNPKTPDLEDDCNLASSGIYPTGKEHGERGEHSKEAHDWNPRLKGYESNEEKTEELYGENPKSPVEREKLAKEYKAKKASVLNYVYYGESREAINILNNAGKLAYNGKFVPKPSVDLSLMQKRTVPQALEENGLFLYEFLFGDS